MKDFNTLATEKLATFKAGNGVDLDLVNASIKSIGVRGRNLDVDIHATAVAAIAISMAHGDTGAASRLANAMPKGSRVKTLVKWFAHYSNIILTFDTKEQVWTGKMRKRDADDYVQSPSTEKALATPFWTEAEQVKAGPFNDLAFANAVAALIKRAEAETAVLSPEAKAALADLKVAAVKLPIKEDANA
jgi:hypothetical protein